MPELFVYRLRVEADRIDVLGHANNVAYIEWMQAAAVAHSAAQGWPGDRYRALGCGWVVRSHRITYHQPALPGQEVTIRTWVATMDKVTSLRRYRIERAEDGQLLADAETLWAFVDYGTGRPRRVPPEVAGAFEVISADSPSPSGRGPG